MGLITTVKVIMGFEFFRVPFVYGKIKMKIISDRWGVTGKGLFTTKILNVVFSLPKNKLLEVDGGWRGFSHLVIILFWLYFLLGTILLPIENRIFFNTHHKISKWAFLLLIVFWFDFEGTLNITYLTTLTMLACQTSFYQF